MLSLTDLFATATVGLGFEPPSDVLASLCATDIVQIQGTMLSLTDLFATATVGLGFEPRNP